MDLSPGTSTVPVTARAGEMVLLSTGGILARRLRPHFQAGRALPCSVWRPGEGGKGQKEKGKREGAPRGFIVSAESKGF
jgi:hypothetical protein